MTGSSLPLQCGFAPAGTDTGGLFLSNGVYAC